MLPIDPNRREFLQATPTLVPFLSDGKEAPAAQAGGNQHVIESQRMPEPRIVLPTDSVNYKGRPKRIAAITTAFWKYSHADDIITKF